MAGPNWEELKNRLEFSEQKRAFLQKRLSQSSVEEDSTLWSFVDLMTLLLILFILFYSHAVTHKASAKNVSDMQLQAAATRPFELQETSNTSESGADDQHTLKPKAFKTEQQNRDRSLEHLRQQVLQAVSEQDKDHFSIRWNQERLVLVLGERITFNAGDADLLSDFQPTLKRIAEFIASQQGFEVTVAGHTDSVPINTTRFPTNWELSAARAVNVAKFLIAHGVNPQRVAIQGYSAYRPLHENSSSHNRHANRRVEITLIKEDENGKAT